MSMTQADERNGVESKGAEGNSKKRHGQTRQIGKLEGAEQSKGWGHSRTRGIRKDNGLSKGGRNRKPITARKGDTTSTHISGMLQVCTFRLLNHICAFSSYHEDTILLLNIFLLASQAWITMEYVSISFFHIDVSLIGPSSLMGFITISRSEWWCCRNFLHGLWIGQIEQVTRAILHLP